MKKILFLILILNPIFSYSQTYQYNVDLVSVTKDMVKVQCLMPKIEQETIEFIFPNIIPGSYQYKEFGRYIKKLKAYDSDGAELKISKADKYNFKIANAKKLTRIEYLVDDSWDEKKMNKFIFQPGGTNIEAGNNFVINNYGFFGYIEGYKNLPFEITINKPDSLVGYTNLKRIPISNTTDKFVASDYNFLADNPILYCKENGLTVMVGKTKITIGVYSANGKIKVDKVADNLLPIVNAMDKFFDGLPVTDYTFLFYFNDPKKVKQKKGKAMGSGYGALEHNQCSFYHLVESENDTRLKETIQHIASHEFLHILTPLNLHSKQIANFDFRKPQMSAHLWMYEGITEYFSELALLQAGISTEKKFIEEFRNKIWQSDQFPKFSMTEMSRNVLTDDNQEKYVSVYSRGALLAMALDLKIIQLSKGSNNLKLVMKKLAKKYGPEKPFDDDTIIGDFINESYPETRDFFNKYIEGSESLNYNEFFNVIGYHWHDELSKEIYYFGRMPLYYNDSKKTYYFNRVEENRFGIINNDVLVKINGVDITEVNVDSLYEYTFLNNQSSRKVTLEINRRDDEKVLKGLPVKATRTLRNYLDKSEILTDEQKRYHQFYVGSNP